MGLSLSAEHAASTATYTHSLENIHSHLYIHNHLYRHYGEHVDVPDESMSEHVDVHDDSMREHVDVPDESMRARKAKAILHKQGLGCTTPFFSILHTHTHTQSIIHVWQHYTICLAPKNQCSSFCTAAASHLVACFSKQSLFSFY